MTTSYMPTAALTVFATRSLDTVDSGRPDGELELTIVSDDRILLTVPDAARRLGISRSLFYELLAAGEVESIHVGRLRRIPADALAAYVRRLRQEPPWPAV